MNQPLPPRTVDLNLIQPAERRQHYRPSHDGGHEIAWILKTDSVNYLAHLEGIAAGRIEVRDGPPPAPGELSPEEKHQQEMKAIVDGHIEAAEKAMEDQRRARLEAKHAEDRQRLEDAQAREAGRMTKDEQAEFDAILASVQRNGQP